MDLELPLPAMLFKRVQRDPDVCNNCFRRTHQRKERNFSVRVVNGDVWVEEVDNENVSDEVRPYDSETDYLRLDPAARGTRVICACGFPEDEKLRPLPKDLFMIYGNHLIARYMEYGVRIVDDVFKERLERLKSDPSEQFADDRLYMKATNQAIQIGASMKTDTVDVAGD